MLLKYFLAMTIVARNTSKNGAKCPKEVMRICKPKWETTNWKKKHSRKEIRTPNFWKVQWHNNDNIRHKRLCHFDIILKLQILGI